MNAPKELMDPAVVSERTELSAFANNQSFENAQRMAKMLAASSLVPKEFQGDANLPNCVIALEMAQRLGASPLAVMQSLYVVHGKPGWSAQYIIAAINTCGKFAPLRFRMEGEGDKRRCVAWTADKSGEVLEGPESSIEMAVAEGWYGKNGSKWKTMPELMLRYRAATFFGRLYAPEIMMGMQTVEEIKDVIDITPDASGTYQEQASVDTADLNSSINAAPDKHNACQGFNSIMCCIDQATNADDLDVAEDLINNLQAQDKSCAKAALLNKRAEIEAEA